MALSRLKEDYLLLARLLADDGAPNGAERAASAGALIRRLRTGLRLSQRRLAERAGLRRWVVERAEEGGDADLGSLRRILWTLGFCLGHLPVPHERPIESKAPGRLRQSEFPDLDTPRPAGYSRVPVADPLSILVVDDDESMLEYCCALLEAFGFAVAAASTGRRALALLEEARFSVVLTDHVTVGSGSRPILHAVRELQPGVPVILMSAIPSLEEASRTYLAGAAAYLPKPFGDRELSTALLRCLPQREPAPPQEPALTLEFEDGSLQRLPLDGRAASPPAAWTRLEYRRCAPCALRDAERCPAAAQLESTLVKLKERRSYERIRASLGPEQRTLDWSLQRAGAALVQRAIFTGGCPAGSAAAPKLEGYDPFLDPEEAAGRVTSAALVRHRGDWAKARREIREAVASVREVLEALLERLREAGASLNGDAVPNSIIQFDTLLRMLSIRAETRPSRR